MIYPSSIHPSIYQFKILGYIGLNYFNQFWRLLDLVVQRIGLSIYCFLSSLHQTLHIDFKLLFVVACNLFRPLTAFTHNSRGVFKSFAYFVHVHTHSTGCIHLVKHTKQASKQASKQSSKQANNRDKMVSVGFSTVLIGLYK